MKTSLAHLVDPRFRSSVGFGVCALVLQNLLRTAEAFRDCGRWGTSGPSESLCGYHGCVNLRNQSWHSRRQSWEPLRSPAHIENILSCILSSLCSNSPAYKKWLKDHKISLSTEFAIRSRDSEYRSHGEEDAFDAFLALHGHRVPESLNSVHDDVNVLCFPELFIGSNGISLSVQATSEEELRVSKICASRWSVTFITEQPAPKWMPTRELFADFLKRGTEYYRNVKPSSERAQDSVEAVISR